MMVLLFNWKKISTLVELQPHFFLVRSITIREKIQFFGYIVFFSTPENSLGIVHLRAQFFRT